MICCVELGFSVKPLGSAKLKLDTAGFFGGKRCGKYGSVTNVRFLFYFFYSYVSFSLYICCFMCRYCFCNYYTFTVISVSFFSSVHFSSNRFFFIFFYRVSLFFLFFCLQVENMLALGPFPRFASSTVKYIEQSWTMVIEAFSFEDAGGEMARMAPWENAAMLWRFFLSFSSRKRTAHQRKTCTIMGEKTTWFEGNRAKRFELWPSFFLPPGMHEA